MKKLHYVPKMSGCLGLRFGTTVCGVGVHTAYGDRLSNRRGRHITCGRCRKTNMFLNKEKP
jgi:hypothetical protein